MVMQDVSVRGTHRMIPRTAPRAPDAETGKPWWFVVRSNLTRVPTCSNSETCLTWAIGGTRGVGREGWEGEGWEGEWWEGEGWEGGMREDVRRCEKM